MTLLLALGCARAEAPRPAAPATPTPTPAPSAPSSAASGSASPPSAFVPPTLDPSEEITPEELATIPAPIPGYQESPTTRATMAPPSSTSPTSGSQPAAPQPSTQPSTTQPSTAPPSTREPEGTSWVWRVQVFASADRSEAERAGTSATARLGVPHVIVLEGGLYKVRLGAMNTEAEAQALRDRAVQNGFPGAFRVRTIR